MEKVAAVVVTYNRKELLLQCIEKLNRQSARSELAIIVVDNASTDGTEEALSPYIEEHKIIYQNTGANLGGAGGFQYGIRYAVEHGYKFVWVMDDDCMPTEDALQQFLNADEDIKNQYGFLSSKVLWKDGTICTMNVQRKTLVTGVKDFSSKRVPVVMASFVSLFIPAIVIKKMGLPLKEFFIWTDDWEYTRRISLKYPCYLCNDSIVIHKSVSNIGANIATDAEDRLGRYQYLYRNDVYLYRREGIKGFLYESVRLPAHFLRVLLKARDHKIERISTIIKGTLNGLYFHPEIEYPFGGRK